MPHPEKMFPYHFKIKGLSIQLLDDFQVAGQFCSSCFGRHWHLLFPAHGMNVRPIQVLRHEKDVCAESEGYPHVYVSNSSKLYDDVRPDLIV